MGGAVKKTLWRSSSLFCYRRSVFSPLGTGSPPHFFYGGEITGTNEFTYFPKKIIWTSKEDTR